MKLNRKGILIVATAAWFATTVNTQSSQAGQWLDAVLGRRPPAYPVGTPLPLNGQVAAYSPGAYPSLGYVPPSYANLNGTQTLGYGSYMSPPSNNAPIFAPGFPQTVAAQLPTAAYDTQWARTPVTYYRPVTAFDPRYGSVVTSLQPCTSYQYSAQRQPVVAPRPLLGEYGLQANRWPSITGPGYNPTGLANAPIYPSYQSIPAGGMPLVGQAPLGSMGAMAPAGGSGVSSGMPVSSLPLTNMQFNPANGGAYASQQPYYGGQSLNYGSQNYASQNVYGQNYVGQTVVNPTYASSYGSSPNVGWPNQAVGSGIAPTAAWLPSTNACANGMCPPTSQLSTPVIPGAASITPVGPPTYSSVPNTGNGAVGGYNPAAGSPNVPNPTLYNNLNPNLVPQVMPNNQFLPNNTQNADPEATVRPTFGNNKTIDSSRRALDNPNAPNTGNTQTVPMVAIDREPSPKKQETSSGFGNPDSAAQSRDALVLGNRATTTEANGIKPGVFDSAPQIPQTLAPKGNFGMQPLNAPEELDSHPRWTPTLLDPEDRVAIEQAAAKRTELSKRIRIQDDQDSAVSAVAFESSKTHHNPIQLVSGVENQKSLEIEPSVIRFRPVTKLK